jgi:tetratricopeptide (TPR) repeat protein
VWLVAVLLAAALPYLNALRAEFTFDDVQLLFTNPLATPGMSILEWFVRPTILGSVYRPLTMASYELNRWGGGAPWTFHFVNVALHVAATLAAFDLARLLLRSVPAAGLAALVFAVHPVHTEAVTSIAGRAELLAAFFAFVCLAAFVRAERGRRALWTGVGLGALALAVISKESAFAIALLLPLVGLWMRRSGDRPLVVRLLPYALVVLASLAVRRAVLGALGEGVPPPFVDNPLAYASVPARLATALVVLADYLGTLALPIRLSADEGFNQIPVVTTVADPRFLAAVGVLAAIAVTAWLMRRRAPVIAFGAAFFVTALVVTSNVVIAIGTIKAERLVYLPSFGWCLAVGWWLRRAIGSRLGASAAAVAAGLALLAARTVVRNDDWRDNFTLFTRTVESAPASVRANANAGAMYGAAGQIDLAERYYARAVEIRPEFVPAVVGLGGVAEARGDLAGALARYLEALRLEPSARNPALRAAEILARGGAGDRAADILRHALAVTPNDPALASALAHLDTPG